MHGAGAIRNSIANGFPGLAVIRSGKNIDAVVIAAMSVKGYIGCALSELRSRHPADVGALGNSGHLRDDIFPGLAAIAGDLDISVIGSGPQHLRGQRRFADGGDGRKFLNAVMPRKGLLVRGFSEDLQFVAVRAGGQVAANTRPTIALIGGFEKIISRVINSFVVECGNRNRRIPLEAVVRLAQLGFRLDRTLLSGAHVSPRQVAVLRLGVHNPRLDVVDLGVEPVSAVNHRPVFVGDSIARSGLARPAPASVVLQSATNVVRLFIVQADFIKLSYGDGVLEVPALPVVVAPVNSAVAAGNDVIRIRGINPHGVKVAVNFLHSAVVEGLAAVFREKHRRAQHPDAQIVVGIDPHLAVIRRPRVGVAHFLPAFALVLAAVDAALVVLHQRVNDVGIFAIDVQADASGFAAIFIRQSFAEFFPGGAAVGGLVNARFRAATIEAERSAPPRIRRGIKSVGAFRVHRQVADSGVVADFQHLGPGLAAVAGLVDTAFRICSPQMAERRRVNHLWISRVNHHATDVVSLRQAHVFPSFAGVGGLVNPVAPGRALAVVRLAAANPHDRGIGRRDGNIANGRNRFFVKHRFPRGAIIGGLPDAASGHAYVNNVGVTFDCGEIVDPPAHYRGAEFAELQRLEFVHRRGVRAGGRIRRGSRGLFLLFPFWFFFLPAR